MPCQSDPYDYGPDLDLLTRVCCDLRTVLRRGGTEQELSPETRIWIAKHDAEDDARIKAEEERGDRDKIRSQALKKLSQDERRALGL
jgi:hypothetical protein